VEGPTQGSKEAVDFELHSTAPDAGTTTTTITTGTAYITTSSTLGAFLPNHRNNRLVAQRPATCSLQLFITAIDAAEAALEIEEKYRACGLLLKHR
jgi:hypothetical protein